jgi:thiamine monophosphate synthase
MSKNQRILKDLKKRFKIICKVHNQIEAIKRKDIADIFFISPVYPSNSHPNQAPLKNYIFLYLCHLLKNKNIYALGGVNDKNFKIKNSPYISGFGGISTFRK